MKDGGKKALWSRISMLVVIFMLVPLSMAYAEPVTSLVQHTADVSNTVAYCVLVLASACHHWFKEKAAASAWAHILSYAVLAMNAQGLTLGIGRAVGS